ncbi:MAG: pentapeptide repeat-containing protein, partial [Pseudomonadota bacterium]
RNAAFDGCNLARLHFGYSDLSQASFKKAKANNALFQHAKLDGANMAGTLLRGGSIDADTTLTDIVSDQNTDFEGLQVLRSTARNALFKDYAFVQGTLHRQTANTGSEEGTVTAGIPSKSLKPDRISSTNKRNQVPPPAFLASVGEAVFNYTNHDGRALIGEGQTAFETRWSNSGSKAIHVYNDPSGIRGVAIAPNAISPDDVTELSAAGLDFTSRTRTPREGQVVVFENTLGRYLAAKVVQVLATSHGDDQDRLTLRYAVVPTDDKKIQLAEIENLVNIAENSLRSLRLNIVPNELKYGGIGHNNPPEPTPLTTEEFDEAINALQLIRRETAQTEPNTKELARSKDVISAVAKKIVSWVSKKCDIAAEAFAKQVGKTIGDAKFLAAAWLAASGRLDQLLAALIAYIPF